MRVLHLGRGVFAIPRIERRRSALGVGEHERQFADGDDREAARLIAGVDVGEVGDAVARHVVVVERLAELLGREERRLDGAAGGLLDVFAPGLATRDQRMRRRNPAREFQLDRLVLRLRAYCEQQQYRHGDAIDHVVSPSFTAGLRQTMTCHPAKESCNASSRSCCHRHRRRIRTGRGNRAATGKRRLPRRCARHQRVSGGSKCAAHRRRRHCV